MLSHINPIDTIPSYLSKIHLNIVNPPMSRSSQWSLSFWLSHQYPIYIPLLPIRAKCPANLGCRAKGNKNLSAENEYTDIGEHAER
jgi:hypothetical protein